MHGKLCFFLVYETLTRISKQVCHKTRLKLHCKIKLTSFISLQPIKKKHYSNSRTVPDKCREYIIPSLGNAQLLRGDFKGSQDSEEEGKEFCGWQPPRFLSNGWITAKSSLVRVSTKYWIYRTRWRSGLEAPLRFTEDTSVPFFFSSLNGKLLPRNLFFFFFFASWVNKHSKRLRKKIRCIAVFF